MRKAATNPVAGAAILAALLAAAPASAITLCVNTTGINSCQTSIQAAVNIAHPLDKIIVGPGTYYENVLVPSNLAGLQILGTSRTAVVLDADNYTTQGITTHTGPGLTIDVGSPGVVIRNLTIRNGQDAGIEVRSPQAVISGVNCTGQDVFGINVSDPNAYNVLIQSIEVHDTTIGIASAAFGTQVKNSLVTNTVFGVNVTGDAAQVTSTRIYNSAANAVLVTGDGPIVQSNDIRYALVGVQTTGSYPTVRLNRINGAASVGVQTACINCFGGAVSSNIIADVNGFGLLAQTDDAGLNLQQNSVSRAGFGLALEGTGIFATGNRVADIGSAADAYCVSLFGDWNVATKNVVARCQGPGVLVNGAWNSATANVVTGSFENGVTVDGDNPGNPPFDNNTVASNRVTGNGGEGIAIINGADATHLTLNTASQNRTDFCDEGTGTVLGPRNVFGTTSGACAIAH